MGQTVNWPGHVHEMEDTWPEVEDSGVELASYLGRTELQCEVILARNIGVLPGISIEKCQVS